MKIIAERLLQRDHDIELDKWILEQRADERTDDWIARKIDDLTGGVILPDSDTIGVWRRNAQRAADRAAS